MITGMAFPVLAETRPSYVRRYNATADNPSALSANNNINNHTIRNLNSISYTACKRMYAGDPEKVGDAGLTASGCPVADASELRPRWVVAAKSGYASDERIYEHIDTQFDSIVIVILIEIHEPYTLALY